MKVCVIGAGITGLAAAYELSRKNVQVDILEAGPEIGGIGGTVEYKGVAIEKYYHHFFKSDTHIISLIKELGLDEQVMWQSSNMGFFVDDRLFDFGTPSSLMKFKPLSFRDKIRFGMTVLKILSIDHYKSLEGITAHEWILKNAGARVYEKVWKPLLYTKFGDLYKEISMAWFWGKIKLRGTSKEKGREVLGYIKGSNRILLEKLYEVLKGNGVNIILNSCVESISRQENFQVSTNLGSFHYDAIICTAPLPVFLDIAGSMLPSGYLDTKSQIHYTAAACMVLVLDRPFTRYYWLNIGDETIPFGGLIEHTNMLDPKDYKGNHILYISNYLYDDSPYYSMDADRLFDEYIPYLKRINPWFDKSRVKDVLLFKDLYAQPVIKRFYSSIKPEFETPVEGLYTASMCNIYPEDRGINYAVRDGMMAAKTLLSHTCREV